MPSLPFRTTLTAYVDEAIHIDVYSIGDDGSATALVPADNPVEWSNLADTTAITLDTTGYNFTSTAARYDVVRATMGGATASFTLHWTTRPVRFSNTVSA